MGSSFSIATGIKPVAISAIIAAFAALAVVSALFQKLFSLLLLFVVSFSVQKVLRRYLKCYDRRGPLLLGANHLGQTRSYTPR